MTNQSSDALESLHRIKEAEKKARELIEDTRKNKTSKIIQEAHEEAQKVKEAALAKTRKESEKKKKAVIEKAAAEAEKIRQDAEKEAEKLSRHVESLMPEAVKKVSGQIRQHLKGRSV